MKNNCLKKEALKEVGDFIKESDVQIFFLGNYLSNEDVIKEFSFQIRKIESILGLNSNLLFSFDSDLSKINSKKAAERYIEWYIFSNFEKIKTINLFLTIDEIVRKVRRELSKKQKEHILFRRCLKKIKDRRDLFELLYLSDKQSEASFLTWLFKYMDKYCSNNEKRIIYREMSQIGTFQIFSVIRKLLILDHRLLTMLMLNKRYSKIKDEKKKEENRIKDEFGYIYLKLAYQIMWEVPNISYEVDCIFKLSSEESFEMQRRFRNSTDNNIVKVG